MAVGGAAAVLEVLLWQWWLIGVEDAELSGLAGDTGEGQPRRTIQVARLVSVGFLGGYIRPVGNITIATARSSSC